ncbi:SDR family oxidoreductase [Rhizobium sp. BK376]|jgi:short-subunit dehydrogenase|uniref:SDR family oxidoreductase n=1 Tax=Rhizobium sp. BK376 TaxID=2512149 RepID=UPI00105099D2|nr:SDR family oxidoreductase [Rhizobium sp. BK376]TCR92113.1 short-subunit dehydrogenase [Rhizobium sp. BK376]
MHVIITGGSSGIGLAIAKLYASRRAQISLLARNANRLEMARAELVTACGLDASHIHIVSVDVASAGDISQAIAACERAFGPCDVLVASAGNVEPCAFDEMSSDIFDEQITTNLLGTVNAVRAVYGKMKANRSGRIMMISSGAAFIGIYGYTAYCASKAALIGFAEALQAEATASGVEVGICFPPDTLTPQYFREMSLRPIQAEAVIGKVKPWTAADVAKKIVAGLDRGAPRIYFGFSIRALAYFGAWIKPFIRLSLTHRLRKTMDTPASNPS